MLRRQSRLRRDYLYRKSLESQQKQIWERKQQLKAVLNDGKRMPNDLKEEIAQLQAELPFDEHQQEPTTHVDDEYAFAGSRDPKILITTSREPSSRLQQFAKEMRLVFPGSQRINRGNYVVKDIVDACRKNDVTDLVILHENRGQPDGMVVCHFPYGPTAYFSLHNVVLRHDIENQGTVSEANPHLIFHNFSSKLGLRVMSILKYLFPVPKDDSKRTMSFINEGDFISFRHHVFVKTGKQEVELAEVGPRFEMRVYQIKLGTAEMDEADNEWVWRPYMRTAKKRQYLA